MSVIVLAPKQEESPLSDSSPSGWVTYRFRANPHNPNPVKSPPPGPFWCRGIAAHCYARMVAILPEGIALTDWWPEAQIDAEPVTHATLTLPADYEAPAWWRALEQHARLEQALPCGHAIPAPRF